MTRSPIIDVTARGVVLSALMVAIYLLAAGHNQPGGGFIAGLVAGAAVALVYVAGGAAQVRELLPVRAPMLVGVGLAAVVITATVPLVLGGAPLEQGYVLWRLPVLGDVKMTSALAFDSGVFTVVVGVVLMAFDALGDDPAPPDDPEREAR